MDRFIKFIRFLVTDKKCWNMKVAFRTKCNQFMWKKITWTAVALFLFFCWPTCCPDRGCWQAGHSVVRSSPAGSDTRVRGLHRAGRCHEHSRVSCRVHSLEPHRASSGSWWSPAAHCWCKGSGCNRGNWSHFGFAINGKYWNAHPPAFLEEEEGKKRWCLQVWRFANWTTDRQTHTYTHTDTDS